MPTSKAWGKAWLDALYAGLWRRGEIRSVLDVGAGRGTFSMRLRDAYPGVRWAAVEAWEPYVDRFGLREKYDEVLVADVRTLELDRFGPLDAVFLGDVLEHMYKPEALAVLRAAVRASRFVFASIPIDHLEQGAVDGNPYEEHKKPDWSHAEAMTSFPAVRATYCEGFNGVYALARSSSDTALLAASCGEVPPEALTGTSAWIGARPRRPKWWARRAARRGRAAARRLAAMIGG